ncbi:MAG: YceI family protein [Bryobacterales bacterium]|nr:YceI family protein [Bryobacterales bacterium]
MRIGRALLALAAIALPAFAAECSLELKPENTKIQWTLSGLHTVHGTFDLKRGAINFDTETGNASGQVVVDIASGDSGSPPRDHRMHAGVLESKKYPEAVFTPDRVEGALAVPGTSNVKLHGMFTIHGAEHEMTMNVQARTTPDQLSATITFDIPYVAWGMKDPSKFVFKVDKTVHVSIEGSGPLQKR